MAHSLPLKVRKYCSSEMRTRIRGRGSCRARMIERLARRHAPQENSARFQVGAVLSRRVPPGCSQLPGIRDPQRDYPFENLSVQCGTTPSNSNTSIQRPLARQRVLLSRRVIAYYGLIRDSESLPATYGFAAESAAPKENRLEVGIQRFPNLLRWTGLACRLPYPGAPKSANDCYFLFGFSLHLRVTGSAITLRVSRLQSSLRADFALMLRPASWLALLSRTFTFELAPTRSP